MQTSLLPFLALLTAHLLGDFVFQSDAMVRGKSDGRIHSFLKHGGVHYAFAYGALLIFVPELLGRPEVHALLFLLVVLHLGADWFKESVLAQRASLSMRQTFLLDQLLHVLILGLVVSLLAGGLPSWMTELYGWFLARRVNLLWSLVVYLATIFGGGYLIGLILPAGEPGLGARQWQWSTAETHRGHEVEDRVEKGGMYIGWLERFVILTAVLAKSPTLIGLIITAKSIVRFKKLDSDRFAEYYLLGTFLSLALALAGGLFLLRVLSPQAVTSLE